MPRGPGEIIVIGWLNPSTRGPSAPSTIWRSRTTTSEPRQDAAASARAAVKLPEQAARAGTPWRSEDPVPLCCDHGQPPNVAPLPYRVVGQLRNRHPHRAKHCVRQSEAFGGGETSVSRVPGVSRELY